MKYQFRAKSNAEFVLHDTCGLQKGHLLQRGAEFVHLPLKSRSRPTSSCQTRGKLEGKPPFTMNELVFVESGASTTMTTRPSSILSGNIVKRQKGHLHYCSLETEQPFGISTAVAVCVSGIHNTTKRNSSSSPHRQLPHSCRVRFTESTMVRVCSMHQEKLRHRRTGEECLPPLVARSSKEELYSKQKHPEEPRPYSYYGSHDPATVRELWLLLSHLIGQQTLVGTSPCALTNHIQQAQGKRQLRQAVQAYRSPHAPSSPEDVLGRIRSSSSRTSFFESRALVVHSPDHGAGKTSLVELLLRRELNCT
jgi:hypothetical protein